MRCEIQMQGVKIDYIQINKDYFLINKRDVSFRNSSINSSFPIKANNEDRQRICEELHLRDNVKSMKGKQFLRNIDNFYIDENQKLGWCLIPKVGYRYCWLDKEIVAK